MKGVRFAILLIIVVFTLALAACGGDPEVVTETITEQVEVTRIVEGEVITEQVEVTRVVEAGGSDLSAADYATASLEEQWEVILAQAREEGEVNFETWCGNDSINQWYSEKIIPEMEELYGITLNYVCDATNTFDRVLAGVEAGVDDANDVDWTNGLGSHQMIEAGLFYGPVTHRLPNFVKYVDSNAPDLIVDFGLPNLGYESPYTRAQFTLFYNTANVTDPPTTVEGLKQWIIDNPGRFTYPNPDVDFNGDAFLKTIFYATNSLGGNTPFLTGFDEALLESAWGTTWDWFNEIKPHLWREGETYPESRGDLEVLYANGEIDWIMSYGPTRASTLIGEGKIPETTRPVVLEDGTVANANFLAIFKNAPNKAAAMVFLNHMLDPQTQLTWYDPDNWGDLPTVDMSKVPDDIRAAFEATERGVATPDLAELALRAKAEISAAYAEPLQQGWVANVLTD